MRKNFEHTADIGIEIESPTLSEAFEEVSLSFSEIITGGSLPEFLTSKEVFLESDNLDSLLVDFLSYLIVLFDTDDFIAGSANIENLDEGAEPFPIVRENVSTELQSFLSNSFGFGGTNASLIFKKI